MFSAEKVEFFDKLDNQGLAVTYDDVRLRESHPHDVELINQ